MKRAAIYGLSWPPVLLLGIMLVTGGLLGSRYRMFTPLQAALWFSLGLVFMAYCVYMENRRRIDNAYVAAFLLVAYVTLIEGTGVFHLLKLLLSGAKGVAGTQLLESGVYSWASNVAAFALWFWLLDRGGPHRRAESRSGPPDLLFPEMTVNGDGAWTPGLLEYLYVAFTNATAFSPTDTLPLSARMRIIMAVESALSLAIVALVTARAVNILT